VPARGGPVEEVRPGDRVFVEPGENHWHGATPGRFNTQIAYQETDDSGRHATWAAPSPTRSIRASSLSGRGW
jgi:quercetin dioxygenase-like cupin family protein